MNGALGIGFRRLPDELVSEIFSNCLELDDFGCTSPSSDTGPLTLSWVCRHWRRICISTPQLWDGINLRDISKDELRTRNRRSLLALLDLWISRSGSCPFSVKFSYLELSEEERRETVLFLPDDVEDSAYVRDVQALIDKLLSCQHRWRALDIAVLDLSVVEPLLRAASIPPAAPSLEHFGVLTQYLGIFGEIRTYNLALSPQLRTIRILSPLIVPEAGGFKFENLEELNLAYCTSMSACLRWIDKAPNLRTLNVRFFTAGAEELQNETRMRRLEKLTGLQVRSFSLGSDPAAFVRLLDLPALVDLFIDTNDLIDSRNWTCTFDLLVRSRSPSLQALTLLGIPMSSEGIIECLRISPGLTYLNLGTITDDVLRALSASTSSHPHPEEPLCPVLEVLQIAGIGNCSTETLINFAVSRCCEQKTKTSRTRYKTLHTFVIPPDPEFPLTNHLDILHCLQEGLIVTHAAPACEEEDATGVSRYLRDLQ